MSVQLLQWSAAIYLSAALLAALGLALETRKLERAATALLLLGAIVHGVSFSTLHSGDTTPPLNDLPAAVSFMAWVGTVFFLLMLQRSGLQRLVVLVAPLAFLGVFLAALNVNGTPSPVVETQAGSWPHAHVLLASAGLSMLGLACLAGVLFLLEHRRLKAKRPIDRRLPLPSLEALDRVNAVALMVGFPLLTLGVITGGMWLLTAKGTLWTGTAHETWSFVAWVVYAVLVGARFAAHQGARQAAASAVGGFAFLFFAVIGMELIA